MRPAPPSARGASPLSAAPAGLTRWVTTAVQPASGEPKVLQTEGSATMQGFRVTLKPSTQGPRLTLLPYLELHEGAAAFAVAPDAE